MENKAGLIFCLVAGLTFAGGCATQRDTTLASLGERLSLKIKKEAIVTGAREKAMENYWDFMNSAPKDSFRIEAMRRLADLELERSEEQLQEQLDKAAGQPEEQTSFVVAETDFDKAITLYENALKESREQSGVEDRAVLYQLAKAYEQIGIPGKALETLNRLLTQHPDIPNRDEIHFRRGEMSFQMGEYRLAELAYTQSMVVDPSSPYFEKSMSKKGWATYKQNKYDKSLYSFLQLIDRKLRDSSDKSGATDLLANAGDRELVNDLFRVVVLSFDEMGGAAQIKPYFETSGHREYEKRIYRELGDRYQTQGRMRDAAETYKIFVAVHPNRPEAPEFDLLAMETFAKGGYANLVFETKIAFVQTYRTDGEYWSLQGEDVRNKLKPVLSQNMEDVARHYHARAQKSRLPSDFVQANKWYRNYIASFPGTEKSAEMNFLLAETLFENKQYKLAVTEYEKTAYQYAKGKENPEAGYAALLAYAEQVKLLQGKEKNDLELLAIESALRFGKVFPNDPRAGNAVTKAAEDLFAMNNLSRASAAARALLELKDGISEDMRRTAWLIVARAGFKSKDYASAESSYRVALQLTKEDSEARENITEGLAASIYKLGEQLKAAGKLKEANAQFLRIVEVAPDSKTNTTAEFDIITNLVIQKNWPVAIDKMQGFRRKHPGHRYQNQITQNLANAYLESGQPLNAAEEIEILYLIEKNEELKRNMLWQLAGLYEEADINSKIVDAYSRYISIYQQPLEQAMEGRKKLADLYMVTGEDEKRDYWLAEIIKNDKDSAGQRSDRTRYLAARATFDLAEPKLVMFNSIQLTAPLKANLQIKKQRMQEAVDAYTTAANYGVAEVTNASIYQLAEIYGDFGEELMKSERPGGLGVDELEQYDILLEEQAYPFEEKSINIHESNIERVVDGNYDEWVKKSYIALGELRPVRYAKEEKSEQIVNAIY